MAPLSFGRRSSETSGARWLERFRATDAWVVAAWEAAAAMAPGTADLSRRLRQGALDCGACLVAAAQCNGDDHEPSYVSQARSRLLEARYVLYLGRRLGSIDAKRYRHLSGRLDRALRELHGRGSP